MPDVTLNGIEFVIKGSADKASGSVEKLSSNLYALKRALDALGNINKSADAFKNLATDIGKIQTALKGFSTSKIDKFAEGLANVAAAASLLGEQADKIANFASSMNTIAMTKVGASAFKNLSDGMAAVGFAMRFITKEALDNLERMANALYKLNGIDLKGLGSAMKAVEKGGKQGPLPLSQQLQDVVNKGDQIDLLKLKLNTLKDALQAAFNKGDLPGAIRIRQQIASVESQIKSLEDASKAAKLEGLKRALTSVFVPVRLLLKGLGKVSSAMLKLSAKGMSGAFSIITSPIKQAVSSVTGFAKGLDKAISGFKRVIGYRAIRYVIKEIAQAFKEGIENLYGWSALTGGEFKTSMDTIATSLQYFKNSLAAAVAPIINALAPAIDFLIDKVVALINVINQLFAKLTGATYWTRAKKKADEYGDSVSGAGAAAKEALKYLAPFDELNRLPDERGGRGSGGSQEDYSDMFEDVTEFNEGISNFADMIKEKVNAGDWQGLGTLLGEKVNDVINMIDFAGLGAKVGTGINAWFTTKYWTFETINFQNIGAKIAEFLNNALANINFDTIGRTIAQKFTNIGDLIIGAVENIDWGLVGTSIRDFIVGSFDQLSDWGKRVDWSEFATSLINGLSNLIQGLDFASIASSFFEFFGTALSAAATVLGTIVQEVIASIKDYFLQYIQDENGDGSFGAGEIISGICQGIVNAMKNIGTWIKTNIFDPFITGFKNAFGIHSPETEMEGPGEMIGEGILEGLLKPFQNIKQWIQEHILNPIKEKLQGFSLSDLLTGNGDGSSSGNGTPVSLDVEAVVTSVKDGIDSAKKKIENFTAGLSEAKDNIKEKVVNGCQALLNSFTPKFASGTADSSGRFPLLGAVANLSNYWTNFGSASPTDGSDKKTPLLSAVANLSNYTTKFGSTSPTADSGKKFPLLQAVANLSNYNTGFKSGTADSAGKFPLIGSVANMSNYQTKFASGTADSGGKFPLFQSVAKFTGRQDGLTDAQKQFNTRGNFMYRNDSLTDAQKTFNSKANFNTLIDNIDTTFGSVAEFVDWQNKIGYTPDIECTATVTSVQTTDGQDIRDLMAGLATGGSYYGGTWHEIPQYASGTSRAHGSLFVAGEAGPEVVGHIGGRTEVLNRSQLAATMYAAVSSALSGVQMRVTGMGAAPMTGAGDESMSEDVLYRAMLRALNDSDAFPDEIDLDGAVVYRKMVQRNRMERARTGVNPMLAY